MKAQPASHVKHTHLLRDLFPAPKAPPSQVIEDYVHLPTSHQQSVDEESKEPLVEPPKMLSALRMLGGDTVEKVFRLPLATSVQVLSTAAGLVATYASNDPSPSPDWASAASLFNQYRVTSYEAWLVPWYVVNSPQNTTVAIRPVIVQAMFSFIDEDDPFTLPVLTDAARHSDTMVVHSGYSTVHRQARPIYTESSNPDDTWNDTTLPVATHSTKFVGNHSLLSEYTHTLVVKWEVEFRGLGF